MFMPFPPQCRCVCICELIIAAQLVFCGWSSRSWLRLYPGWDHRAGIVLSCGEPVEMSECASLSSCSCPPYISPRLSFFFVSCIPPSAPLRYGRSIFFFLTTCVFSFHFLVHHCVQPSHPVRPTFLPLPHLFASSPPGVLFSSSVHLSSSISPSPRHKQASPVWLIWMDSGSLTPQPIPSSLVYFFFSLVV